MRRFFGIFATAVFCLTVSNWAAADAPGNGVLLAQAVTPADSDIAAVMSDLDRFEKQAAGLAPGQGASAKRIQKLLKLSEDRLNGSSNKGDPSWISTNDRLQTFKAKLTDLAAGKAPGAAPNAAPVAPAAPLGGAVDPRIAAANADLRRIDAIFQAMPPGDKTTGRKLIEDLNKVAAQLGAYPDRTDPEWAKTAQTYNALNQQVAAKANAPAAATPPTAPAAGAATADASEQRVQNALRRLREYEVRAEGVTPGMPDAAIAVVKQLDELPKGLVLDEDQRHPRWNELSQRYQDLRAAMLKIAIDAEAQRLTSDASARMRDLKAMDPVTVQVPAETAKWREYIAGSREQMATLPDPENAKVKALGVQLDELEQALEQTLAFVPRPPKPPAEMWSGEWPMDVPVLIDTVGPVETTLLVQVRQARPLVWVPEPSLLVRFAGHESDDVVLMQVKKDGEPLGKPIRCSARTHVKSLALSHFTCQPSEEFGLTDTGLFTIELTYRQTLLQQNHDLATLTLPVVDLKHGARNNPTQTFGDDMDARLNVSTIEEAGGTDGGEMRREFADALLDRDDLFGAIVTARDHPDSIPHAVIRTWFKSGRNMIRTKISCFHDGKKVAEAPDTAHKERSIWTYTDDDKMNVGWSQVSYALHDLKFRPRYGGDKGGFSGPTHWLSENPGDYRCVVTGDGEVLKELHFTIGADGLIEKPACQAESMKNMRHVTLIRQLDKKKGFVPYDESAGREKGYFGNVTWAEGCPPML